MELIDVDYAESKGIYCLESDRQPQMQLLNTVLVVVAESCLNNITSGFYEEVKKGEWLRDALISTEISSEAGWRG